jgi:hypothetical protein
MLCMEVALAGTIVTHGTHGMLRLFGISRNLDVQFHVGAGAADIVAWRSRIT